MTDERYLTVPEIAERLRVTEWTVYQWLRKGRLHGYQPGGRKGGWRVSDTDLRQFIAESRRADSAED
jgi:excisionase family DNA binding protein